MIIFCDIDHTIASAFWRDPMIGGEGGWDAYHAASADDKPIEEMARLISFFNAAGATVIGLTTRPEKWRKLTMDWLVRHGIRFADLLMRPADDFRPAAESKTDLIRELLAATPPGMVVVLDDREDVCAAFKGLGVTVLQVHARNS